MNYWELRIFNNCYNLFMKLRKKEVFVKYDYNEHSWSLNARWLAL